MGSRRRRAKFEHHEELAGEPGLGGGDRRTGRDSRKRGREELPQHEIDLHGCTLESAVRRLGAGLARHRAAGISPVLVITGKGHGSHGGRPILAPGVERWLGGPEAAGLGVASIRAIRGGGAFEVSIKRS
jgi:DNA-nicking Smr family endonuclease